MRTTWRRGIVAGLAAFSWAAAASAQAVAPAAPVAPAADEVTRADTLFKEAMQLHGAGQDAEACPKFAESKQLAPGIGVTLYLADCYARTGHKASAWQEFRDAERLARARGDKRADVAAERATALEPQLNRLTIAAAAGGIPAGADIQLDGAPVPASSLNAALAVDPGDHVVTVAAAGQPVQTFPVHVDAALLSTSVRIGPPEPAPVPAVIVAPPVLGSAATAAGESGAEDTGAAAAAGAGGRWAGLGLAVAGGVGVGIGTWLITSKTRVMDNGELCEPHLRHGAIPGAIIAYSAGGAALISGFVLYYVNRPGRTAVSLGPTVVPGGAGAVLGATF